MALSITWLSERTCQATFAGNIPSNEQLADVENFSIEAHSGVSMTIYKSTPTSGIGTTILHVGPAVFPGSVYVIKFANETSISEVPGNIKPEESTEWSHKMIDVLTEAFGEAVQRFSGKPQTFIVSNFHRTDTALYVESTLGFPFRGSLFVDGKKYTYTSKDAMSFRGISPAMFYNTGLSPQTLVTCDVSSILPN